ncbi:hypothetical protein F5Y06DRAFT_296751 [Hypoxylon sp. FL0890]|nr:hypothetical protein F5Y06DRAFT_296751 [Hypoxylon sp. FL0890]
MSAYSNYSTSTYTNYWRDECELAARKILRKGFLIDAMPPMTNLTLGREQPTEVVLVISTGARAVHEIAHYEPGIKEGLLDMTKDGLDGRMILYGLGFQFQRREDRMPRTPKSSKVPRTPRPDRPSRGGSSGFFKFSPYGQA